MTDVTDAGALADAVATAALAVPGVTRLHAGTFGEVATYLPGRRVDGVRVRPDSVEVHVVTTWESPVLPTADAVRVAVQQVPGVTGRPVDVTVDDVEAPASTTAADAAIPSSPKEHT